MKKTIIKFGIIFMVIVTCYHLLFYLSLIFFPIPDSLTKDFSNTYYYDDNTTAWISLNNQSQYRIYTRLKDTSPYITKGIINYEDKYYYLHPGFNPVSLIKSLYNNIKYKKIISGGSTITMQLARLIEPKKRTYINKIFEILRAMQLEVVFSKNKILEYYLSTIPMGGNIQGIEAASFFHFNKMPKNLTFLESSLLLCISNSPYLIKSNKIYPEKLIYKRNKTAKRIAHLFRIDKKELDNIFQSGINIEKTELPVDIIPLVEKFNYLPKNKKRYLNIDRNLQNMCLNILKQKMDLGSVENGALILIDNHTMAVKAYIGSPFYNKKGNAVKFNACNTRRSPGSTLKPFIYAKALEKGIISQKTKLLDFPIDFSGYAPKNFTNNYYGVISADEALYRSLNIPAIILEQKLGEEGIKSILKKCGFLRITDSLDKNDLSIVLGTLPLTLENLVELYASLANKGILNNISFFKEEKIDNTKGVSILQEESSYIISEILSSNFRPDLPASWEFTKDKSKIAFKTGTSYGYVDAWAIGYTPDYTCGVWIGNLNNKFSKMLTGITYATPVLFKILNELGRENDSWFVKPEKVETRDVCTVSGKLPGKFCENTIKEYYYSAHASNETCNVHKRIVIDKNTGRVVSLNNISGSGNYQYKTIEVWPEDIENYLKKYGKTKTGFNEGDYQDISVKNQIKIISPQENIKYVIYLNKDTEKQKIKLSAYDYPDSKNFYWYADGIFIGAIESSKPLFYQPKNKKIKISVIDDKGRSASVVVHVSYVSNY